MGMLTLDAYPDSIIGPEPLILVNIFAKMQWLLIAHCESRMF